jgi:hypothetical protein
LKIWKKTIEAWEVLSTATIELDSLSFLKDTSSGREWPEMQEDDAGRKEVKEDDPGRRKWKLKHRQCQQLTLGLNQITKFVYRLDGPLGEGNV